ncbi:DUF1186 domain-containing protein [Vibrio vulnificus]|uniref:DUF1186 domain-containing protein n=1 Tax=Vibrio vulnificus TaxID=672 RepID=A0A2S3R1Q4_VIBVL|nr:DUF1186 domain-containing protein [Vibrio vulnificus]POB47022.1 hypothetical protein CRN52_13170 [Vibrio vulnificus]
MTVNDIIRALSIDNFEFPRAALSAARNQWAELLPEIHKLFDAALGETPISSRQENLLYWSILLLADQNETDSFEKLVSLCINEGKHDTLLDRVLNDDITETLPTIFYTLCNGRSEALSRLMSSLCTDEYIKVGAIRVLYRLHCDGVLPKAFFNHHAPVWMASLASNAQAYVLSVLGCFLIELDLKSFQPEMLKLCEEGLIDEEMLYPEEVDQWVLDDKAFGTKDTECLSSSFDVMSAERWVEDLPLFPTIEKPSEPKMLGRNDPCFCGSGKKYKKCCLN